MTDYGGDLYLEKDGSDVIILNDPPKMVHRSTKEAEDYRLRLLKIRVSLPPNAYLNFN